MTSLHGARVMHQTRDVPDSDFINDVPVDKLRDPEAELGGADSVQKTTYVTGEGTSPERRKTSRATTRVQDAGRSRAVIWIVVALVILGALAFVLGIGR
jgi:hypothetical protein